MNVTLAEGAPKWVKGVRIENNEIVFDVRSAGTVIFVRQTTGKRVKKSE